MAEAEAEEAEVKVEVLAFGPFVLVAWLVACGLKRVTTWQLVQEGPALL